MAFKDYISKLSDNRTTERTLVIEKIAQACGVDKSTVYRWANGVSTPDKLKMEKVSEITGIPVVELFNLEPCSRN